MALTQKTGALANAGAQAQSAASTLANLAANLHYTGGGGQPRKSYGQEPVYYAPAPVNTYRPPQQTGSFSSGGSAAAAQHLIQQARNQQQLKQNVFNDAAKQAVLTALAVATGQQPGRSYQAPPTLQYRQGSDAAGRQLTPQQESQLFDQQIQATKLAASQQAMPGVFTPDSGTQQRISGFNANIDTMRSGFTNARPNPRLTQEGQALSAFPQMTPQDLRTRSDSQLQALLDLAKQPPASAAGSSDQVGGQETSPNDMTRSQPPKGPPPQPAYSPLPTWDTTRGAPAQPPYSPLPTGPAQVSQAMEGAMKPFGVEPGAFEQTSGDTMGGDSGGGGLWDTVGDIVTTGLSLVPGVSSLMQIVQGGKAAWDALSPAQVGDLVREMTEAGAGTYEQFLASGPGQVFATIMNGLDAGRQWNTGNVGALAYRTATKSPFFGPGDWDSDHYISLFPPLALAFEAAYRADPTLEARVVDWHDNGYSSPSYIKTAEAAGIDWHEQPQFTGDQAVYEGLMGLTDQMPAVLKYPFRMATDILLDPLSMLTVAAKGGAVARELGIGLRTAEDATLGGRVIGGILEGTGAAVEGGARLPDLPVEGLVKGGGLIGGKVGEVTGLLSPGTAGRRIEASADIARLSDAIAAARESVPDVEMRTAFDAEAQGVAPTSGPELIETPAARTETPTVVAREGGEPTVTRSTGTATIDTPNLKADEVNVDTPAGVRVADDPSLSSVRYTVTPGSGNINAYVGDYRIGNGVSYIEVHKWNPSANSWDEVSFTGTKLTGMDRTAASAQADELFSAEIERIRKSLPGKITASAKASAVTPTATERHLADVNRQIKENQALLKSGDPDKMMVAAEKLKLLHAEWERLRGEIAAEKAAPKAKPTPPATKAEREAAAAAGSTPDTPRSPGASETVRAAENAKATTGKGRRNRLSPSDRRSYGALAKAEDRAKRLAKEDREGLPKEVNKILAAQKPGEHEFSPIYGGHRPLDQIVTKAIDSKDPALMKKADAFVKKVDQAVEQHLRPDPFYRTWKNGGAPVRLQADPRFTDEFYTLMDSLEPEKVSDAWLVADAVGVPAPNRGMTRLYRIESTYTGPDRRSAFIKVEQRIKGYDLARGRWFADDPAELGYYIEDMADAKGRVRVKYIDVPTGEVDGFRVTNAPVEPNPYGGKPIDPRIESARPDKEFFISRDMADRATTMTDAQADLMNDLIRTRDNRPLRPGGKEIKTELVDRARRRRVLANGLAKGTLDDIAELQFQLNHLLPMLTESYADEFTLDGIFGAVGRIESKDYKQESAKWLIREYLDTPNQAEADKILHTFLTGETEAPLIADGIHKPYAHSIVPEYQAESIARLQEMRAQWRQIKRAEQVRRTSEIARYNGVDAIPSVEYGGDKVVARLRWRANKEGGQRFGNYEVIRERPDGSMYSEIHRDDMAPGQWLNIRDVDEGYVRRSKATGWARQVTDFNAPVSVKWGSVADSSLPTTKFLEFMREQEALGLDGETLMGRRTEFLESVPELSDAAYRDADIPAQLEGGKKSISKQMAAAMRATKHSVKATDEAVNVAIGEIKDAEIAHWLLNGDGKLTIEQAKLADRAMPSTWRPTGYTGGKTEWNVKEALDWIQNEHARHPSFDYAKARDDIGQLAHGLQPKMTPAQVKAARKAAEAQGIDPKTIKDGTTMGERLAATKLIRALDWKMRNLRALRLYNVIIGLGNRIGDIAGNSVAHLIGRDVRSALLQTPKTFTETSAWRRLARDPAALNAEWVKETPHMAELGITYPDNVLGAHKLSEADPGAMLPPLQGKLEKWNAPRGVKWLSNAWTAPYLKDMTMAGEMVGRKLSFDRVVLDTIKNEAWPAFKEYLEGRFPGQSDQLLKDIYTSAREKGGKSWSGHFSAGDVQKVVDEDAARKWQREVNRAVEKGGDEADHLFFKGKMTNADEIARRTLTFHFWMVRASALYGRTLLRNPGLLSGFYRLHEEAQQIAEEQGLPGWLGTMYKFMSIPGAGSGYGAADPINILFPLFFLDAYSQEGNKFQAFQNLLIPEWSAALGALGLTQNIPDQTGTRSLERFVVDMGNFLKGEGVDLEAIPFFGQYINTDSLTFKIPTEEFAKWGINKINDAIGQPFGDFKPFDRAANEHDQLYSIGEQIGQGLWGEDMTQWTAAQIDELTTAVAQAQYGDGEETWLSETIRAAYGREGAARAFGALVIPGGIVTRQEFRDSQIEQSHDYWQDFYDGKPTTKAGESAALGRQLATSAQPAWIAMNTDYYQIGTKQEQSMYSSVNDMLFSPGDLNPNQSIIIDNGNGMFTVYNMSQLAALSDDERRTVVYAWLDQNKGVSDAYTKVKDGRAAFKDAHPDYAQYTEYQKGVFGYQGGPTQFRRDMQDNPTFKAAEDEQRKQLKKEGKTGAVLEAELDHWATTQEAFFAATGQKYKTGDTNKGNPGPSSVAAMFSLRPDNESSGSGGTKKEAPKDPTINDYWSPAKGVPRLAEDQAQFEHDNAAMEATFGPYWNEQTGKWEKNADSAKERDALGIGDIPYVMPSVSETMRRYEEWEYRNPGGSPEEFFAEMLQTPGFGKKVGGATTSAPSLPGGTVVTKPAGVAAYPSTPTGKLQAAVQNLKYVTNAPKPGSRPEEAGDAAQVIGVANSFVGKVPYVWGGIPGKGDTPTGWDCSGMTYWLDQNYGSGQLPMGSHYQYQYAQDTGQLFTDMSQLQPGDIVFIDTGWMGGAGSELNRSGHVGIYAGNGQLINALNPDAGTVIEPLTDFDNVLGAMHGSWTGA